MAIILIIVLLMFGSQNLSQIKPISSNYAESDYSERVQDATTEYGSVRVIDLGDGNFKVSIWFSEDGGAAHVIDLQATLRPDVSNEAKPFDIDELMTLLQERSYARYLVETNGENSERQLLLEA